MEKPRIMVVEDESIIALSLQRKLTNLGYQVPTVVPSGEEALEQVASSPLDLILMDIMLKGEMDGIETAKQIQQTHSIPIVYLTSYSDKQTFQQAKQTAPAGYLSKPFDERRLQIAIEMALYKHAVERKLREGRQKFETTLTSIGDAVITVDGQGKLSFLNPATEAIIGWSPTEAQGQELHLVLPALEGETQITFSWLQKKLLGNARPVHLSTQTTIYAQDDSVKPIDLTASPILSEEGDLLGIVIVIRDITKRKQMEDALKRAAQELSEKNTRLQLTMERMSVLSQMNDSLHACQSLDEAHEEIGRSLPKIFPEHNGMISVCDDSQEQCHTIRVWGNSPTMVFGQAFQATQCKAACMQKAQLSSNCDPKESCDLANLASSSPYLCVPIASQTELFGILHLHLPEGLPQFWYTESKKLAQQAAESMKLSLANIKLRHMLQEQSVRDPLTGVFNRRYLEETVTRELSRAQREGYLVSLVMLDIDFFKRLNDTHGHQAGDLVLQELSQLLQSNTRKGDIICRYGGEEFVVVLVGASPAMALLRAEEWRKQFSKLLIEYKGEKLQSTISLGVATYPVHAPANGDILRSADLALYEAKASGRNTVVVWENPASNINTPLSNSFREENEHAPKHNQPLPLLFTKGET
ncbi:MAG: diguanylate cyclase [Deltaproteobacteria bacterium]|nr:MAG: diguanylate cyclase [Deltaproteobacteria bacterium]